MILSTLGIKDLKNSGKIYLIISGLCLVFALIYEKFSHGVISYYMICAFLIPLLGGAAVSLLFVILKPRKFPAKTEASIYGCAIATLTIGSIIAGVLEIYGTTNSKVYLYPAAGLLLIIISVVIYFTKKDAR